MNFRNGYEQLAGRVWSAWHSRARLLQSSGWLLIQSGMLVTIVLVWGLGIAAGCFAVWNHADTPGSQQAGAEYWPAATGLHHQANRATLVLFAHPHCPCTRATIRELDRLVAQTAGELDVQVVFVQPSETNADWAHTDIWCAAAEIPGVSVTADRTGAESIRFGADTSGEAFLYDASGRLVFQGGITPARGHEGDSAGRTAVTSWVTGHAGLEHAPVFGCPLLDLSILPKAE